MSKFSISSEQIANITQDVRDSFGSKRSAEEQLQAVYQDLDQVELKSGEDALRIYFLVLYALEHCSSVLVHKAKDRHRLSDMALKCLQYCHIMPVTSQHSYLYSRLHQAQARFSLLEGNVWESVADTIVGEYLGRDSKISGEADILLRAEQAWRLGHLRTAKIALHTFDMQNAGSAAVHLSAVRLLMRIYRLSGELEHSLSLIFAYRKEFHEDPETTRIFELEEQICLMAKGQDPKDLAAFLNREKKQLDPASLGSGRLWLAASRYRDIWKSLSKSKAATSKSKRLSGMPEHFVQDLLDTLEELYDQDLPLQHRLAMLGTKIAQLSSGSDPEAGLLFLAASIRWLHRIKQITFASILIDEYQAQSLKFSDGISTDSLKILHDLRESVPVVVDRSAVKQQNQLYTGMLPRFLRISQIAAKATFLFGRLHLKPMNQEDFRQQQQAIFQEILKDFEKAFSDFKGPAMKIGQMLAASCFMNEEAQDTLRRVYDHAQAVSFEIMKQPVEQEFPQFFANNFETFVTEPIAVASIGEVFKASLAGGISVAVKIKYPEVEKVIASDMRLARVFMPIFRVYFARNRIEPIFDQYRQRFEMECDYLNEARNQMAMAENFADDPFIHIPKSYPHLCNKHLLVSEFIHGTRLDEFIQTANQEQRNHVASVMLRFLLKGLFRFQLMHIDPHLANFIVDGDRLVVLDFGAVISPHESALECMRQLVVSMYRGDFPTAYQELTKIGLVDSSLVNFEDFKQGIGLHLMSPFHLDRIQTHYGDGNGNILEFMIQSGLNRKVTADASLFFVFTVIGFYKDLGARCQAELNWHQLMGEVLRELGMLS